MLAVHTMVAGFGPTPEAGAKGGFPVPDLPEDSTLLCLNSCKGAFGPPLTYDDLGRGYDDYKNGGYCRDGGPDSIDDYCDFGTDCKARVPEAAAFHKQFPSSRAHGAGTYRYTTHARRLLVSDMDATRVRARRTVGLAK